jgi:hypothetical protein
MALYAYNKERNMTAGPFDAGNNANGGILPVQSLTGDTIIIEWNIPLHFEPCDCFTITSVGYGFRGISGQAAITPAAAAAACNVDVNCKAGNHWQREIRSVVKMETITRDEYDRMITRYCSGVLINQASDRKEPYILTANHCISTPDMAQKTSFIFGYETPACSGTKPLLPAGIAGSRILATKKELDFTLLKLSTDITASQNAYYAGWNTSPDAPVEGAGIHHPQSDVKKISVEKAPLVTSTFKDEATGLICDDNAHWMVRRWDAGITEPGSSGSPFFDQNHLVVGVLSGGQANCSVPEKDYYAKFSEQWNKYPTPDESLSYWLDPDRKGIKSLNGYDPVARFDNWPDTASHIGNNETEVLIIADRWGYLTGHNNKQWTSFAEKIENDTIAKIVGIEASIAKVFTNGSKVSFSIWTGNDFPSQLVYSKEIVVTPDYRRYPMHVYMDKALEIKNTNFFIGYSVDYRSIIDTFAVFQSAKRPYSGVSALFVEDGGSWKALNEDTPPLYSSLGMKAIGQFGKKQAQLYKAPYNDLKVVFQPNSDIIQVYSDYPEKSVVVECFDTSGKQMPVNETGRHILMHGEGTFLQIELNIRHLPYGMYFIRVQDSKHALSGKFIKI